MVKIWGLGVSNGRILYLAPSLAHILSSFISYSEQRMEIGLFFRLCCFCRFLAIFCSLLPKLANELLITSLSMAQDLSAVQILPPDFFFHTQRVRGMREGACDAKQPLWVSLP